MGRAPDLRSYVKQGCEESWTEVELKGLPGKRNTVLSCRFTREDDKSEWKIDGAFDKRVELTKRPASDAQGGAKDCIRFRNPG